MAYNLVITDKANELIDNSVRYILDHFKNPVAAQHLLDEIDSVYVRLAENPYQFGNSTDMLLKNRGYKEALLTNMKYKFIFRIEDSTVYIVGFFHDYENYQTKVAE